MMKNISLFIALIIFSSFGVAMSIFDAGKAYVFSPVEAVVTLDGKPVANAKVIRRWELDKIEKDQTTTDENGHFIFPGVRRRSIGQAPLIQFVAGQQIIVVIDDKEFEIWTNSKMSPEINSELGGTPLNFTCEVTDEPELRNDFNTLLLTSCKW